MICVCVERKWYVTAKLGMMACQVAKVELRTQAQRLDGEDNNTPRQEATLPDPALPQARALLQRT